MGKGDTKNKLNRMDVFVLAFGAMIGWGWVVLSGEWIDTAGTLGAVLAFVLGGALVLFVGLVYAELASAMPTAEGVLLFSKTALGDRAAFVSSWSITLGFLAVIAFEAVALPSVLTYLFPDYLQGYLYSVAGFDVYGSWLAVGVGVSLLVAAINYIGVKFAAVVQTVLTCVILVTGAAFLGGTAATGSVEKMVPLFSQDGIGGLLAVAVMTPFLYVGFDVIPQAAGEMNIPARNIGRILVVSVILAVCWYVLIIVCVGCTLTHEQMLTSELPTARRHAHGVWRPADHGQAAGDWRAFRHPDQLERLLYRRQPPALRHGARRHAAGGAGQAASAVSNPGQCRGAHWGADEPCTAARENHAHLAVQRGRLCNGGDVSCDFRVLSGAAQKTPRNAAPIPCKALEVCGIRRGGHVYVHVRAVHAGLPSALTWPYEWAVILGWAGFGLALWRVARHRKSKKQGL